MNTRKNISLAFFTLLILFPMVGCKKKSIDTSLQNSEFLIVEKKNMSFIQKHSGTWCIPCGGWGFTTFSSLYSQFGATEAFGASVSGNMGPGNNEKIFETTADMHGSAITGTPSFLCNLKVEMPTAAKIEAHRNSSVVANSNYEMTVDATKIHVKTTTQFFQNVEGKDYYLIPYVIVDGIVANQDGHSDGANTVHKKTIVDVAYLQGKDENSLTGYKIAEGTIEKDYKINLNFELDRASSWPTDKISIVLVIATKGSNGKYNFVNAFTKH